jgi:cation diffusion facilitator family transporter
MADSHNKPIAVYGAITANLAIAVTKFLVAFATGSSSMLSEGIHSLADTGNQALLLLGIIRGKRPADEIHPFGYGKELYFWSLIVAIILFGIGGGMSIYEGITHIRDPESLSGPGRNYLVLAAAAVFESTSFVIALRELRSAEGTNLNLWAAVKKSKDPAIFVVILEDTAALAGLLLAFLGYSWLTASIRRCWTARLPFASAWSWPASPFCSPGKAKGCCWGRARIRRSSHSCSV